MTARGPIFVVDPDATSRDLLRTALRRLGGTVDAATSAAELRRRLENGAAPALVVVEVDLPDASGYELCRELHEAYGDDLPVIFVAGHRTEPRDRVAGLLIGGDDYLVKPIDGDELLARVRRSLHRAGVRRPDQNGRSVPAGRQLTPREREVLALLADGLTQKEIAAAHVISAKTVGTHLQRVLGKLGVHNRAQAVALALREGLVGEVEAHVTPPGAPS